MLLEENNMKKTKFVSDAEYIEEIVNYLKLMDTKQLRKILREMVNGRENVSTGVSRR